MTKYKLSFADAMTHEPEHPERTARKNGTGLDFDVTFQVWPNRASLLKTIEMQDKGYPEGPKWRACQKGAAA